jgi:adenylate kinase
VPSPSSFLNALMIVLVVGPSGIGKGTALGAIENSLPEFGFGNLDDLASIRGVDLGVIPCQCIHKLRGQLDDAQLLLAFGMQTIGDFAARQLDRHTVIDVGAAFQDARSAQNLRRIHPVVCLIAEREVAYQRFIKHRYARDRNEYMKCEFSDARRAVYDNAHHRIDTTKQSPEETASSLAEVLRTLLNR